MYESHESDCDDDRLLAIIMNMLISVSTMRTDSFVRICVQWDVEYIHGIHE